MHTEIDYAALGQKIKKIRLANGLTQSDLADMIFCNTSHISNIENNHTKVSLNSLLAIANSLNTSIDNLLSDQLENTSSALDTEMMMQFKAMAPDKKKLALRIIGVL